VTKRRRTDDADAHATGDGTTNADVGIVAGATGSGSATGGVGSSRAPEKASSRLRRRLRRTRDGVAMLIVSVAREAVVVMDDALPAQVASLDKLSARVAREHETVVALGDSAKPRAVRDALLPLMTALRTEIVHMVDMLTSLRLWVQTCRPAHELGSSGVRDEVLGETLRMVSIGRSSGVAVANGLAKYHWRRAEIRRAACKEGWTADLRAALLEHDTKQLALIRQNCADLSNSYAMLRDKLTKHRDELLAGNDDDDWRAQFM